VRRLEGRPIDASITRAITLQLRLRAALDTDGQVR